MTTGPTESVYAPLSLPRCRKEGTITPTHTTWLKMGNEKEGFPQSFRISLEEGGMSNW